MAAFKQRADTVYDSTDLSIVDVQARSEPKVIPLSVADHDLVWQRLLVPNNTASADDKAAVQTFLYRLPWLHRTYTEFYPDNKVIPMEHLMNFLAVPMQFAVSSVQYVNYTSLVEKHPLPDEMITTATGGRSIQRFVSQPWAVWTFIAAGSAITLLSGLGFVVILCQQNPVAESSGILEMAMAVKITTEAGAGEVYPSAGLVTFADFVREIKPEERGSTRRMTAKFRGRRVKVVHLSGGQVTSVPILLVTERTTRLDTPSHSRVRIWRLCRATRVVSGPPPLFVSGDEVERPSWPADEALQMSGLESSDAGLGDGERSSVGSQPRDSGRLTT